MTVVMILTTCTYQSHCWDPGTHLKQCKMNRQVVNKPKKLLGFKWSPSEWLTFCFCFFLTTMHDYSKLLHHTYLYFVYICFPMRWCERDHMLAKLQSAEPWGQSAEATPLLLQQAVSAANSRCNNIERVACPISTEFETVLPLGPRQQTC